MKKNVCAMLAAAVAIVQSVMCAAVAGERDDSGEIIFSQPMMLT